MISQESQKPRISATGSVVAPTGSIRRFYDRTAGTDLGPDTPLSWNNLQGFEKARLEHPEEIDFLDPASPLHYVKALSRQLYMDFFEPACWAARARTVLDAGCGIGRFWPWFCGWAEHVTAFDASLAQLETAIRHLPPDLRNRVDVRCSDIDFLDEIPTQSVDVVWATEFLCYLDDPEAALRVLVRAARPGGILCLSVEGRWAAAALREEIGLDALTKSDEKETPVVTVPGELHLHLFDSKSFKNLCRAQGLDVLEMKASHFFVEGVFWRQLDDARLADPRYRAQVLDAERAMSGDPRAAEFGRALMAICRKPGG